MVSWVGCSSWVLLLLAMGGKLFKWGCAGFVHLVYVPLETHEKDVLYVGFASKNVTLCIVRSCVALGISLCSRFLVCC